MSPKRLALIIGCILVGCTLLASPSGEARAAREPPPALLEALDREVEGETVVRAAEAFAEHYRDHPRAAEAAEILAEYRYILGEYKAAARHYADATARSRRPVPVRRLLGHGRSLLGANDFDSAAKAFEDALRTTPETTGARLGLADAALMAGDAKRAATLYTQILDHWPTDPVAPLALSQRIRALEVLGRGNEALADARRLIDAYPRASEAAAARDRLRREEREATLAAEGEPTAGEIQGPVAESRTAGSRTAENRKTDSRSAESRSTESRSTEGYSLQLGAFGNQANAQDLARKLEKLEIEDVRVEEEERSGGMFYRVRCGSYADPVTAEAAGKRLQETHGLRYQVVTR